METIQLTKNMTVSSFHNFADDCIGTGRMGLALQRQYQEQLRLVQEKIGFKYIRGHGLFSDDMAIYQEYEDETGKKVAEYNFTYLDIVMDFYQEVGIKPYLELGFMPQKLASGDQTVFYWQGNVTPPRSYEGWCQLVQATLQHLITRYGRAEVVTWPVEVWNEPNLPGFWQDADMTEYFKLFKETFLAVKAVDDQFKVGGPAICGVDDINWLQQFMAFCHEEQLAIDTVTRHFYTISDPETAGHYSYVTLREAQESLTELDISRSIIDDYPEYRGLPMHITEFNTSYRPDSPLHDTNLNAAYIAQLLSRLGETSASYSYWTFGDIFEEMGVPFTPFHGGFGLVANGNIPKPTFWTFAFYKKLQKNCLYKGEHGIVTSDGKERFAGVFWNLTAEAMSFQLDFPEEVEKWCITSEVVDQQTTNPLQSWHDLGEPANLSAEQRALLQQIAQPKVTTTVTSNSYSYTVQPHGVHYFEARPRKQTPDRGYDYQRVLAGR
ncbi:MULTISPECIES: GH39 family glycosyl hydrolase [Enterococcus]|jgi:xylan 1,4-beta-xylosidase|uniref:GH39 family glycosyl hydrolase n=1 Tax=Enterococcus TaxID=1350 RepID=UPI000F0661A2|nr:MULTISPECIES: glycosyl hydrolase [Enterococcus]